MANFELSIVARRKKRDFYPLAVSSPCVWGAGKRGVQPGLKQHCNEDHHPR
jgi:hypothetical protein